VEWAPQNGRGIQPQTGGSLWLECLYHFSSKKYVKFQILEPLHYITQVLACQDLGCGKVFPVLNARKTISRSRQSLQILMQPFELIKLGGW